jgi:acylphosphatase
MVLTGLVSAPVRVHAIVRGDVQGVGFRYYVADHAHGWGLSGWVRNQADGSVECVAEGAPEAVDRLVALLRRGPSSAEVGDVEVEWEEPKGDLDGFQIRGWGA